MTEETIAAGEFKAKCLKLMADVERTGQPLVITKRGKPIVKLVPYVADDAPESAFGCMQDTGTWQLDDSLEESPLAHEAVTAQAPESFETTPQGEDENDNNLPDESNDDNVQTGLLDDELEADTLHIQQSAQSQEDDADNEAFITESEDDIDAATHILEETESFIESQPEPEPENTIPAEDSIQEENTSSTETPRPRTISRTAPPNRGLPIESEAHHRVTAPSKSSSTTVHDDDELFIPPATDASSNDGSNFALDDFLEEDDEDDFFANYEDDEEEDTLDFSDEEDTQLVEEEADVFQVEEKNEEPAEQSYIFTANQEELDELDQQLNSEGDVEERKERLAQQFTSAWNRRAPYTGGNQ